LRSPSNRIGSLKYFQKIIVLYNATANAVYSVLVRDGDEN